MDVETEPAAVTPAADHAMAMDFNRAMAALSLEHRQVILLVGLEGLSYQEVAQELGIPVGTVMSRLARARERLRREMEQEPVLSLVPNPRTL
jgi:RNA polymerase sigma-70 factor (ECF subfamily)